MDTIQRISASPPRASVRHGSTSTRSEERIGTLDLIRGIAVLGILAMNVVSFGLGTAPYFNLDAGGSLRWWDWLLGVTGEVFVDQKFMALFSLLFGAGVMLFWERAEAKGRRPLRLTLRRNALLLAIGLLHGLLWDGDVLAVYALAAPLLVALHRLPTRALLIVGASLVMLSPLTALWAQGTVGSDGAGLGGYWTASGTTSDAVGLFLYVDAFARALGLMLIGMALYRNGALRGAWSRRSYRRLAAWGLGAGLPLAAAGVGVVAARGFGPEVALIGTIPNTVGTVPVALGYLALIVLWGSRWATPLQRRLEAVGRMALTNYLSQTLLGIVVLRGLLGSDPLARGGLALFVLAVWALQLAWSPAWLRRYRFGPAEWLWRSATYGAWQPLRREPRGTAPASRTSGSR